MKLGVADLTRTLMPHSTAVCAHRREVPQAPGRVPAGVPPALLLHGRAAPLWARVPADGQHRPGAAGPLCAGPPPDAPGSGCKDAGKGASTIYPSCIIMGRLNVQPWQAPEAALPALMTLRLVVDPLCHCVCVCVCVCFCFSCRRSGPRWLRCGGTCSGAGRRSSWGSCAASASSLKAGGISRRASMPGR